MSLIKLSDIRINRNLNRYWREEYFNHTAGPESHLVVTGLSTIFTHTVPLKEISDVRAQWFVTPLAGNVATWARLELSICRDGVIKVGGQGSTYQSAPTVIMNTATCFWQDADLPAADYVYTFCIRVYGVDINAYDMTAEISVAKT